MIKAREGLRPAAARLGLKLTYLPIIVKAVSVALGQHPEAMARLSADKEHVVHPSSHNIGIAIDTPKGLVVPNIKRVETLSILEVGLELARLTDLAQAGRLPAQDVTGGGMTISNIGAVGGTYMSPVLMPGEPLIVALGALTTEPRYDPSGCLQPTPLLRASWAADHRTVAGATLARLSNSVKALLADPSAMLLHLR